MFDSAPDLTSDLDWLLQSGQAPKGVILETLVQEHYTSVYHLALAILDDPSAARGVVDETFSAALANLHTYRGEMGVQVWLYRQGLKACYQAFNILRLRRTLKASLPLYRQLTDFGFSTPETEQDAVLWLSMDKLDEHTRWVVLLHYVLGWRVPEIGQVLELSEEQVDNRLRHAGLQLWIDLGGSKQTENQDALLFRSLSRRWPAPHFSPADLNDAVARIARLSSRKNALHRSAVLVKELVVIGGVILAIAGGMWGANLLWPEPAATPLPTVLATYITVKEVEITRVVDILGVPPGSDSSPILTPVPRSTSTPLGQCGAPGDWVEYQVKPGDTLYGLSQAFNVSIEDLQLANCRGTSEALFAGEWLMVPPTSEPTPSPASMHVPSDVFYLVKSGDTLPVIAARLGTSPETLLKLNRIPSGAALTPGQLLLIPGRLVPAPPAATPVPSLPKLAPLNTPYVFEDILQRMQLGRRMFHTVWFDAQVIDDGPPAYIGPPRMVHVQAWLGENQYLVLSGWPDADRLEEVWLDNGDNQYIARPSFDQPWFSNWEASDHNPSQMIDVLLPLFRSIIVQGMQLIPGSTLHAVERESVADVQALVVDEINAAGQREARYWLDDRTGLVLRKQFFGGGKFQTLLYEYGVTAINYNVDFPQELFDISLPWRNGFALDYTGQPIPMEKANNEPLPEGHFRLTYPRPRGPFNHSHARLAFQYPADYDNTSSQVKIDLFADSVYLGQVTFGNPWTTICQRSPDGLAIAYVSQPSEKGSSLDTTLYWFYLEDLHHPENRLMAPVAVTQFAFAPDSRRLAVFGYERTNEPGTLSVLDTGRGGYQPLLQLADARSLVWSPDGRLIAMIARLEIGSHQEYILVVDAKTGEIIYKAAIETESDPAQTWPALHWGVDFPVEMGGLDECSQPPK